MYLLTLPAGVRGLPGERFQVGLEFCQRPPDRGPLRLNRDPADVR